MKKNIKPVLFCKHRFRNQKRSKPYYIDIRDNRGFSILEVLIAFGLMSILGVSVFKTLDISLLSAKTSNSLLADIDLRSAIYKTLETDELCNENLDPAKTTTVNANTEDVPDLSTYDTSASPAIKLVEVIKAGDFGDYLEIVKVQLEDAGVSRERELKVYYKRKGLKHLSTSARVGANEDCNSGHLDGCYIKGCRIEYDQAATPSVCSVLDCASVGSGPGGSPSIQGLRFDGTGNNANLLLGRRINIRNTGSANRNVVIGSPVSLGSLGSDDNVIIGRSAGASADILGGYNMLYSPFVASDAEIRGDANMFFGLNAGRLSTVSTGANHNVFIGHEAGINSAISSSGSTNVAGNYFIGGGAGNAATIQGDGNMFIGRNAGRGDTVSTSNIVNLGDKILMKSTNSALDSTAYNVPNDEVWINGDLKQCGSNGTACKPVALDEEVQAVDTKVDDVKDEVDKTKILLMAICTEMAASLPPAVVTACTSLNP